MWKESDMQATMELADVIIVNYGLHYLVCAHLTSVPRCSERSCCRRLRSQGNVSEHDEMMPRMFKQLEEFASRPGKAVFFRETGAEHRNVDESSAAGGFLEVRAQAQLQCCRLLEVLHPFDSCGGARGRAKWATQIQRRFEDVNAGSARSRTWSWLSG